MPTDLQSLLREALRRHGHESTVHDDWLLLREESLGFRVSVYRDVEWGPKVCQVDFEILVKKELVIVESFGVAGATDEERARSALARFCLNTLHPLLAGLCQDDDALAHVEKETWTSVDGVEWSVYLGGWLVTTYDGEGGSTPEGLFSEVQSLIERRLTTGDLHWCRIFYDNAGGQDSVDVLWDNEPWPEAEEVVDGAEWRRDGRYSARCFLLLRHPASSAAAG